MRTREWTHGGRLFFPSSSVTLPRHEEGEGSPAGPLIVRSSVEPWAQSVLGVGVQLETKRAPRALSGAAPRERPARAALTTLLAARGKDRREARARCATGGVPRVADAPPLNLRRRTAPIGPTALSASSAWLK